MTNILVTGGAGYIGSHVCKALAARGHTPVTYDNLSRGHEMLVRWGPLERGDVGDGARLRAVFAHYKPAAVIHLAGYAFVNESVAQPALYHTNNVMGTLTLLDAMRDAGIDRIVASSSCSVYASAPTPLGEGAQVAPASPYAASKVAMEQALADAAKDWGLRWVALRYFNAAGADPDGETGEITTAGVRVIPNLFDTALGLRPVFQINGDDYPTSDGTCVRDYTHVCDIADAHLRALAYLETGTQHIFNLGNGQGHSIRAMVNVAEAVTGRSIKMEIAPRRPGDPACLVADAGLAARTLPWTPRYPALTDMIAHAWAWHRKIPDALRTSAGP
jgi:UDP-arabinose 4-epimerase